ncbi:MAG: dihydrolipoamide acetyltransferase family protein [Ramlibacter sp.]
MAIRVIKIPDIGEGIAEVELVAWHVKVGDTVVEDEGLADVMTDKATVEVPSPVAGKVLALGGEVGQLMAVGAELIRIEIEVAGANVASIPSAPTSPKPQRVAPTSQPSPGGERSESPVDKPIASPSVRRRAWELGVDLDNVKASGTAGRITHADLDAAASTGATAKPSSHPPVAVPAPVTAPAPALQRDDEEKIPIIGLRRKIAQKMQESKRRIPHFTYVEEVDVTELEALRARLNAKGGRTHLTLMPFLMRAIVVAVREFPQVNARFDDEAGVLTRYGAVHMGIATQTEAGLMVPVVRQAQALDLWASAAEVVRVSQAARSGKATRDDLSGSTITITSLGALGGIVSTPIINFPEVAIVGVNRMVLRPMMMDNAVVPRQMMNLSSSFDHRVVDGQLAAQFIQALRAILESPAMLFVE